MGNIISFLFGEQEDDSAPATTGDPGTATSGGAIPAWCKNTADYAAQTQGTQWTAEMCETAMQKDVQEVVSMKDQFMQDLGHDENGENEQGLVLSSFDNSSKVPQQGTPGSYVDDARWTVELTSRVSAHVPVGADRKNAIRRRSKLSRRSFYDIRGQNKNTDFGEIDTVFAFSGKAWLWSGGQEEERAGEVL